MTSAHIDLVASVLRQSGFPVYIERDSDLQYYIAVKFARRMVSAQEVAKVLEEMIEDGLVTVRAFGGVGIVNIVE